MARQYYVLVKSSRRRSVMLIAATLALASATLLAVQNQTPARPQIPGQQAPGNQTPPAPELPTTPGIPLYVSPGIVRHIQQKLAAEGYPVPSISGAWGEHSSAALGQFQRKHGLDPGGDLDELTIVALDIPQVLDGDVPPGAEAPAMPQAIATGGAQLYASPRLTRLVQNKLTESGHSTDNVFGVWLAGSETAVRNFQKAKGLDITSTLDLRVVHSLGLTASLAVPKPGKLPTDNVAQILADRALIFTGAPLSIGPAGIKQIQTALVLRGFREVVIDGKWNEQTAASVKKFQELVKLEPTGSINLRTARALGFNKPLADLDQPMTPKTKN
jgi:peptidoglycan hydrolase-like protein with peptidoglycan-binding domain